MIRVNTRMCFKKGLTKTNLGNEWEYKKAHQKDKV